MYSGKSFSRNESLGCLQDSITLIHADTALIMQQEVDQTYWLLTTPMGYVSNTLHGTLTLPSGPVSDTS